MKSRKFYEELFADYPDVVTLLELRQMLGGVSASTARKLMRENHVQHFYIRNTYLIPKPCLIDFVRGEYYAEYSKKLKVRI